jgi:hypothetical protein
LDFDSRISRVMHGGTATASSSNCTVNVVILIYLLPGG